MSVLIKGMEMPESCNECKLCDVSSMIGYCNLLDEYSDSESTYHERQKGCPLIGIPTPHGRLIDADAVNKAMDERIKKLKDDRSIYEASCVSTALDMFALTVIEAEGSEE